MLTRSQSARNVNLDCPARSLLERVATVGPSAEVLQRAIENDILAECHRRPRPDGRLYSPALAYRPDARTDQAHVHRPRLSQRQRRRRLARLVRQLLGAELPDAVRHLVDVELARRDGQTTTRIT